MVARRSGTNTRRESVRVRLPSSLTRRLGNNAGITKIKAQEGKDEPDACLYVLDTVDGEAQLSQYGCHHCRLGRSPAHPTGCQAFLRLAAFARLRRRNHQSEMTFEEKSSRFSGLFGITAFAYAQRE